LNKEFLETVL